MAAKLRKTVYDMSAEELEKMLQPVADDVLQKKWDKNGYITYHDEQLCERPDIMIHEYKDRRELVRINEEGKAIVIKQLDHGHRNERTPSTSGYRRT